MYSVNQNQRRSVARQMLGVSQDASFEEITSAFKARVSDLPNTDQFREQFNRLSSAYELLTGEGGRDPFDSMFSFPRFPSMDSMFGHMDRLMRFDPAEVDADADADVGADATDPTKGRNYFRSFSKTYSVGHDGTITGRSRKVIHDDDKKFEEEKEFDSGQGKMRVKRIDPDGKVSEYETPYDGRRLLSSSASDRHSRRQPSSVDRFRPGREVDYDPRIQ